MKHPNQIPLSYGHLMLPIFCSYLSNYALPVFFFSLSGYCSCLTTKGRLYGIHSWVVPSSVH